MPIFSSHRAVPIIFLVTGLICSCGDRHFGRRDHDHGITPLLLSGPSELETYPFQDPGCQNAADHDGDILSTELFLWGAKGPELQRLDVTRLGIHQTPLRGRYVSEANYGGVFKRHCDSGAARPPGCLGVDDAPSGWRPATRGSTIKLCNSSPSPDRFRAEHLALIATTTVEAAASKISDALGLEGTLKPIEILIAPRFETHWSPWSDGERLLRYESVMTDNMSYFAKSETTPPYLALLPKRKRASIDGAPSINLWESMFIVTHEYGHHVEDSLAIGRFSERRSRLRIAASEAFADLIAFSSLGGSDSLTAIPCTGKDRAPDSMEFTTGIVKIITPQILQRAANSSPTEAAPEQAPGKREQAPCQGVAPHSPHGLGAILAYWIAHLSAYTPGYYENPQETVMKLAVNWLKKADEKIGPGSTPAEKNAGIAGETETLRELESIAAALEDSLREGFARTNKPIPSNIRDLLRQKMTFAFQALNGHNWFPEQSSSTANK